MKTETVKIKELANTYADPEKLIYVIVGDAKTQLKKVQDLGLEVKLVNQNLEAQEALKK